VNGLLAVDKPSGPTSHDVVQSIRRLYGVRRVGHAGTLDPPATGVLLIGVGRATRLLNFLQGLAKGYRARIQFGTTTTTQDAEGEMIQRRECEFSGADLVRALSEFVGVIEQVPPMFSAIKVEGEPLYKAGRRGEEVERRARKITIYSNDLEGFEPDLHRATVEVRCSSGTYVRTLAYDLGERLGCGAHLDSLRRLSVGSFVESEAIPLSHLEEMGGEDLAAALLPMAEAMRDFPKVAVEGERLEAVRHGRPLPPEVVAVREGELRMAGVRRAGEVPPHRAGMTAGVPVAVVGPDGELVAVYRQSRSGLKPAAVLAPAASG
jgi:tRNA pseudouridine55 synthase